MNFLKKGPELKMPSGGVKLPGWASEIYEELRQRHLLPLVVVLVVAIVAVPIALSESAETRAPRQEAEAGVSAASKTQVVVAKSTPGLRDYRKRLDNLTSTDPFKQRYTNEPATEEGEGGKGGSGGGEEAPETTSPPTETSPNDSRITFYSFAMDVRVTPVSTKGKPSKAKPQVRKDLPELTALPSRESPAIVFMGVTKGGDKALMLVSSNVKGVFGDNVCAVGGETCELLALEPGVPEIIVYGGNEKVFKVELLDLTLVRTDKLNKAPLGKPGKGKGQGNGGGVG
jgi:hypothetical protein